MGNNSLSRRETRRYSDFVRCSKRHPVASRREVGGQDDLAPETARLEAAGWPRGPNEGDPLGAARPDAARCQPARRPMLAARGAPQLEAGQPAEDDKRLTDGAGGSMQEHALASLHPGRAV